MRAYAFLLVIAAAVTYLATPVARWLAQRTHAMTAVRDRDVHTVPTPRLGGVAMLLGFIASFVFASQIPFLSRLFDFEFTHEAWAILGGAVIVCLLGVADDIWELDPFTKLLGQILAAGVLAWGAVQLLTLPIGGLSVGSTRLSLIMTMFAVIVAINAVNFVDGLDGLAAGVVAIGGSAFALYAYVIVRSQGGSPDYASLAVFVAAAMVGCCLGFLVHNAHPARIFMGDSGAMLLGLLLAASAIVVTGQLDPEMVSQTQVFPVFLPILLPFAVMIVPLTDLVLAVIRRVGKGQSPFSADRRHLHHRLLQMGHSHRRAVLIMYLWTAVASFGTVLLAVLPLRTVVWIWVASVAVALILTLGPLRQRRSASKKRSNQTESVPSDTEPPTVVDDATASTSPHPRPKEPS